MQIPYEENLDIILQDTKVDITKWKKDTVLLDTKTQHDKDVNSRNMKCKFNIIPIKILIFSPRTRYVNFKVNREK